MDRIVIVLTEGNQSVSRIFLQGEANGSSTNHALVLDEQTPDFVAVFNALVEQAEALYNAAEAQKEATYVVTVDISGDPHDATITRKAYANLPVQTPGVREFNMPVLIRHFRNGQPIRREKPDFTVNLRATDTRLIDVNGQQVPEYTYFEQAAKVYPMPTLMEQQILVEDSKGRFNGA